LLESSIQQAEITFVAATAAKIFTQFTLEQTDVILSRGRKVRPTRKSVQQPGWLILEGNFAARPCTVLDLSDAGAKIRSNESTPVHSKLRLAFSRDVRTGRACEVVWQRGKTFGVKFI